MFTELPKLFGKTFFIGYFLPSSILFVSGISLISIFGFQDKLVAVIDEHLAVGVTVGAFIIWVFSVILMALNYPIIRILEGYGKYNPLKVLIFVQRRAYGRLTKSIQRLENVIYDFDSNHKPVQFRLESKWRHQQIRRSLDYPTDEDGLMPTKFGNTISAFESYSKAVYGLDAIRGWVRLYAVIPDFYRAAIDEEKALMDFWVNLWFGCVIMFLWYIGLSIYTQKLPFMGVLLIISFVMVLATQWARIMAEGWGEMIKAAFDLYKGDLCEQLGFSSPSSLQEEKRLWTLISQMMIYGKCDSVDELDTFRKRRND